MVVVEIVKGNLLHSNYKSDKWYIAQQCNCNTVKPHGLSQTIADKWSYGDPYRTRGKEPDVPGTIVFLNPNTDKPDSPTILCLMAQWGPSKPGRFSKHYPKTYKDTYSDRRQWFQECLDVMDQEIPSDQIVNFPYQIGCGLAGGI